MARLKHTSPVNMKTYHVAVKLLSVAGLWSVDVSTDANRGGYCRRFCHMWDAQEWAQAEFGLKIPDIAFCDVEYREFLTA